MCRIAGIIDRTQPIEALKALTKEMCDLLRHGGPDDEGIYYNEENHLVLGNRRLALLDLTQSGHMPMTFGERYTTTYNGEVYNFKELKTELKALGYQFNTGTDTEVILAAFSAWGTDSFKRLNGMFALALWDNKTRDLYLARGISGIKPLYYAFSRGKLAFASEVRAFAPLDYLQTEDPDWKIYMMAYGNLPEPNTTLKDVKMLPKGSYLKYHVPKGTATISNYYHHSLLEKLGDREDVLHQVRKQLSDAVDRHLIADAPIGVFLSGGLDSSLITLLANANSKANLNTLSIYFNEEQYSEKKFQDVVLKQLNCNHQQYLLTEKDFHNHLPNIFNAMDLPSSDGINTWFISKYARESGLKAVLSGIGGDELFGGYPSFQRMNAVSMLEKLPNKILRSGRYSGSRKLRRLAYLSLPGAKGKYLFLRGQFIPSEIAQQLGISESEVWNKLEEQPELHSINHLTLPNQASWMEMNLYMQNQLLRDSDVMSMAHGLEIRVPFLDKEFLTLAMQVKSGIKYQGHHKKQLLIDAFKELLPEEIWNRPKMGFSFPFKEWMSKDEYVEGVMTNNSKAREQYNNFLAGKLHWSQLMTLLLVERQNNKSVVQSNGAHSHGIGKTLFLTLKTFSATGGIEKVCRIVGKALNDLADEEGGEVTMYSMHDPELVYEQRYFPSEIFKGFKADKISFVLGSIRKGRGMDTVILSHINLLSVGYLIKKVSPKTRIILFAHGIEVWKELSPLKKAMLQQCDLILPVSKFTKEVMMKVHGLPAGKFTVLNNCLDPFLPPPATSGRSRILMNRYGLTEDDQVLMTLTRLSEKERYKGYEKVLGALKELRLLYPHLKYLIVGKYDAVEKARVDELIEKLNLEDAVIFAGFIADKELADHFNLADIYIMPSEKEGFGIVFIEAMFYGKPVIAGNIDGSVDALLNGELGLLVNPESEAEVMDALVKVIEDKARYIPNQDILLEHFGYYEYIDRLKRILETKSDRVRDKKLAPQK